MSTHTTNPYHLLTPILALTTVTLLSLGGALSGQAETRRFGTAGRDGADGRPGRHGADAPARVIRVGDQPQTVTLVGGNGTTGEAGQSGEHASNCRQPTDAAVHLVGATGGDGGRGGAGGNGGQGGAVTIYYQTAAQLQTLVLQNAGGQGAPGGPGGRGGRGCPASQPQWRVASCTWALMAKSKTDSQARWREVQRRNFRCSGDALYDQRHHRPQAVRRGDPNYHYGWKYIGVARYYRFTARDGRDGRDGPDGRDGRDGGYGQVRLVPGDQIPTETPQVQAPAAAFTNQVVTLVKNRWRSRQGLRNRLGAGSMVPDTYQQLETIRRALRLHWPAQQSPQALGNPTLMAAIDDQDQLQLTIPGTLEYTRTVQGQTTVITVVNGFHPQRLGQFQFRGFDGFKDVRNFGLWDAGNLLPDLRAVVFTVALSNGAQTRSVTYRLQPQTPPPDGVAVLGQLYKFSLGSEFDALLQPEALVRLRVTITQITKMGATYESGLEVEQVVDKLTPNPPVTPFQNFSRDL